MKKLLLFLILFGPFFGMAQTMYDLSGQIDGLNKKTIYLLNFYGEKNTLIDSTQTDPSGVFSLSMPATLATGMYRLNWGKEKFIDLIFNKENIDIHTHADHSGDSLQILESVENTIYYDFMIFDRTNQMKLELIQPIVDYYPTRDPFYFQAVTEYEEVQQSQVIMLDSLQKLFSTSYAIQIIELYQTPYLSSSISPKNRLTYLKQHYFDNVNFNDTALLRSNAWANKSISYLGLYGNSRLNQKQLEAEFIKATTIILSAASENPEVFKFILDYLVSGFDKYHFEDVITYIAENFQDPYACEDPERKSELQKKLDTFKKIAIGQPAPDFVIPDKSGNSIRLSEIPSPYTLLIFWASDCPHCINLLPKVKTIYAAQDPKLMEVLAVSIDTSRTYWMSVVNEEKLDWINASELKGFDSESADLYNIYATPTMFLLDKDKIILSKPISYRELEVALRENKLL
ncbi:MAG: redoxin domain-containing protein [Bacteroidales bacterium]|nr:redoxin domain-containing protein [Bacteroidales bacterium]